MRAVAEWVTREVNHAGQGTQGKISDKNHIAGQDA
jgi:hypothetical protein